MPACVRAETKARALTPEPFQYSTGPTKFTPGLSVRGAVQRRQGRGRSRGVAITSEGPPPITSINPMRLAFLCLENARIEVKLKPILRVRS